MKEMEFDIQRFDTDSGAEVKKVALEVLNVFGQIVTNLGLKKLAEELDKAKNATEWLTKNANPVLSFIGTTKFGKSFGNYAKLITNSISIIDNTLDIVKGGLPDATRNSKIGSIAASLESMASATAKLTKDKSSENLWFLSIVSGGISLTASLIAGMDGVTESEQEKINRSYISFMKTLGSDLLKKIFDDTVERAFSESVPVDSLAEMFKKGTFFKDVAPVFLKTFNGIMTFGGGILNGYSKYKTNLEKYLDDGIPEDMAKHDAFIDAVAKFAKETMSGIVFGVDNVIFDVAKWITSGFGIEYAEDENKDYIETLIYNTKLKNFNYTNTGLSTDDTILYVLQDNVMVYGDSGNDAIKNFGFSNATIFGGHDNDTIHSYKTQSSVSNNNITPCYNSILGGPGNDQITIYDKYSTIYGGKGEDTIFVTGTNNVIFGDTGNDSIAVFKDANQNTVSGGTGDDKIILLEGAKNALIKYAEGDGNDTIYYFDEDDALKISGSYKISTNDSDIKIKVGNGSMLLVGAAGKNIKINGKTITNSDVEDNTLPAETIAPPNVPKMPETVKSPFIYGTDGNDYIYAWESVYLTSGAGNDSIENKASLVTIDGGTGNDYIYNSPRRRTVTINAGEGDDSIHNDWYCENVSIYTGTGNDSIYNGDFTSHVTIDSGDGDDTIVNRYNSFLANINGNAGNDSIFNGGSSVTIDGGAGVDSIFNGASHVTINGGDGDDSIHNLWGSDAKINGGDGDDYIENEWGSHVTINGGDGDDTIVHSDNMDASTFVTINAGAGNDFISLDGRYYWLRGYNLITYANGDGNDTIYRFTSDDKLQISGAEYSTVKSGEDIKIIVGDGSILVKNNSGDYLTIDGTLSSDAETVVPPETTPPETVPADTLPTGISISNSVLTASTAFTGNKIDLTDYPTATKVNAAELSRGISIVGKGSSNSIKGGSGSDTITGGAGNDTVSLGAGTDVYIYSSGDDLIQDYTSGQDKIKLTNGTISSASVSSSNVILNISNGGKITIQNGKDKEITFIDSNGKEFKQVYPANDNPEPNDSLTTGMSVKSSVLTATNKFTGNKIDLANYPNVTKINASTITQSVNIVGNSSSNSIKGGKGADTISGGSGNDTLTGGIGTDLFVYSSGNDVITDYKVGEDKIKIGTIIKSSVKGSDVILTTGNGTLTVKGAKDKVVTFMDNASKTTDKIFFADTSYAPLETGLSYDAKRTVLTASNKFINNEIDLGEYLGTVTKVNASATSKSIAIIGNSSDNSIKAGKSADTISGGNGKDTIFGGAGNDSIYGGNDNDKLQGDAGNDTLNGGNGNDTLTGGAGNDVFVYQGGNDLITDYKVGEDKIKIGSITKSSVKGSDVILTTANGNVTVKATKDKIVTFVDNNGKTTEKIFFADTSYEPLETGLTYDAKRTVLTASNKFTDNKIDLGEYLETVTKVNASAISKAVDITGNSTDNSIKGGKGADTISGGNGKDTILSGAGNDSIYGGNDNDKLQGDAGNDTLNGGNGNDTLTGGAGNDVFVYEGGNDVITDYKPNEDIIKLNPNAITSSSVKGSDVILTTSNGILTVKATKDKVVTFVDNNGKTTEKIFYAGISYEPLETGLTYDAKRTVLTASNKFTGSKIDLGEYLRTVTKVNASAISKAVDIIGNSADNSIKSGKGADTISGGNGKDSIFGGTGNDSLYGGSDNDKLQGDTGNDTLNGGLGNDTLTGGAGNDVFVYEGGNDVITDYKPNEDKIKLLGTTVTASSLSGSNVILKTSSGNITVQNGKNKKITVIDSSGTETTQIYPTDNLNPSTISTLPNGWKYDNTVQTNITASVASAANVDLNQSYGTSVITVDGSKVTQNISITGNEKNNVIKGGSGADAIYGNAGADIIYGGSGADKLYGDAGDDSLYGGTGNDTLIGGTCKDVYIYNDGDGNDVIEGFDSQSTLKIWGNGYSTIKSDNDIIVKVGNGNISLIGAASLPVNIVGTLLGGNTDEIGKNIENQISNTLISGTTGNDSIVNFGYYYTTINAGEGDDTVYNYSRYTTINAGNGNDYVHIQSEDSKVNAGEGNDTIYERGYNSTIYGGDGDDSIFSEGNRYDRYMNLIDAGKGNDTISLDSSLSDNLITHLITYSQGDGNDTIYGYNANDTIHITSGSFSTLKSGNDFIIKVGSNGSITLKDALTDENSKVRIKNSSGNIIMYGEDSDDWSIMSGTNGDDTLNNTLNGVAIYAYDGNNSINNIANYTTIIGGNGSDTIDNDGLYVSINAGSGNDSISNYVYKGIVSDVTINGGDGNDIISNKADYVIIYGGTGNDKIYNGGVEHGNFSTIYSGEGNDSIYMDFYSCGSYVDGGVGNDYVSLSGCNNLVINGGDGDDNIYSPKGVYASNDIVVSGGKGNDKITFGGKYSYNWLVQYYSGDGNDTIWGMDDNDTLQIIGTTYSTITQGNDLIVNVDNDHILLKDAATIDINIENLLYNIDNQGEYIMVSQRDDTIKGTSKNDIFINYAEKVSINSGSGDDIIYNKDANASIDAGKGNDYIHNEGYIVILNAGEGNDTINGQWQSSKIMSGNGNDYIAISGYNNFNNLIDSGAGNDKIVFYRNKYKYDEYSENNTIKGGIGDDFVSIVGSNDGDTEYSIFYQYSEGDGNDVIYGINGTDTLQISGAKYTTTKSGNDLIIGVGTGSISVVGGANVDFTIDVNHKNEIFDNANKCICDLIYDNNFVTDDFVLDDISEVTETNYSVGKLEYSSNNNELANNSIVSAAYFDEK